MTLRRRGYLVEGVGRVRVSLGKYSGDIKDYVYDLVFEPSESRTGYTKGEAREDLTWLLRDTKKNMQAVAGRIQTAIERIDNWQGSSVVVSPHYSVGGGLEPVESANVRIFQGSLGRINPDFTYFDERNIDDVLDAGDTDFFRGKPGLEGDYFLLVQELRSPGSTGRSGGENRSSILG
jgi:hypothetical protein